MATILPTPLDKLKIKVNVFRAGEYKSAAEPFIRNNMSPQAREETADVINRLWQGYTSKIENLRQLNPGAVDDLANNLDSKLQAANGDTALLAKREGLVDQLATRSEMHSYLNQHIPNNMDGDYNYVDMDVYLAHLARERSESLPAIDKVAVVVAKGTILDGQQPEGDIGADTLAQILSDLFYDPNTKAIVLRIDSPGEVPLHLMLFEMPFIRVKISLLLYPWEAMLHPAAIGLQPKQTKF